jgi:transposase
MLNYKSLSKRPRHFLNFTGLTISEFQELTNSIKNNWLEQMANKHKTDRTRKIGGGRKLKLAALEDRLLVFLLYAKLYPSYLMLEYLFDIDESNVCRIIQEFTPILSKKIIINRQGKKITTLEELRAAMPGLDEVLLDATEQKINRPKKKTTRKKYHSGKQKSHTIKTQIITDKKGLILNVSKSRPGRAHDYKYFKQTKLPCWLKKNQDVKVLADAGYQGVNKDYPNINFKIPVKRTRAKKELTRKEKIYNTKLRKKRIVIEHTFAYLKKYQVLAGKYRNLKENYSAMFKSIAFLTNLRMLARTA